MEPIDHPIGCWLDGQTGTILNHQHLMGDLSRKQAVLLGETHDRYDIHRWQLHVVAALHALRQNIVVGFEMFPRRVQPVLDRWVAGEFSSEAFLQEVEWNSVWGFPAELYMSIFHFCREFRVPMKTLNCRRSLVTEVGKLGWAAIPEADRDGLTPAAPASAAHRRHLFALTGGQRPGREAPDAMAPEFDRFVRAQQTWDRAFACNIAAALQDDGDCLVIGIIGRGHLEFGHGTPFQLADLGITDVAVLLPEDEAVFDIAARRGVGDAVFRLGWPEHATRATPTGSGAAPG